MYSISREVVPCRKCGSTDVSISYDEFDRPVCQCLDCFEIAEGDAYTIDQAILNWEEQNKPKQ